MTARSSKQKLAPLVEESRLSREIRAERERVRRLEEINRAMTSRLKVAMDDERSKRWPQVIRNYNQLLKLTSAESLPPGYKTPHWFSMLLFEIYYHKGVALQNIGEHRRASREYTRAIEAVFETKNGCVANCCSNTCLMTPLYARRAVSKAMSGDLREALKDAEKAVVLDSKNPDVLCVRALMLASFHERQKEARHDLDRVLARHPKHLCALILRGNIVAPKKDRWDTSVAEEEEKEEKKMYHTKACDLNPDCHNYLTVHDMTHPKILTFFDRFLFSLVVPHTISKVALPMPPSDIDTESATDVHPVRPQTPFRAGTPARFLQAAEIADRRRYYGDVVREHVTRPRTADQYMAAIKSRHKQKFRHKATQKRTQEIEVFHERNTMDAPRMYYRPWHGDKLPVTEISKFPSFTPPFKV